MYDGVFVLTTNTGLSCIQVVERYKDLWQIESAFRQLKSELKMGPIYHHKDRRIRAHIMVCFLAFCMKVALYKKLKEYFDKESFSITELMRDLKALHAIELDVKGEKSKLRTELKEGANHIFRALYAGFLKFITRVFFRSQGAGDEFKKMNPILLKMNGEIMPSI